MCEHIQALVVIKLFHLFSNNSSLEQNVFLSLRVGRGQAVEQFTPETVAFHPHSVHSEKVLIMLFDSKSFFFIIIASTFL